MENSLEFIENMTNYYSNYNENFIEGYMKIIQNFYEYLINEKIIGSTSDIDVFIDQLYNKLSDDKGISPNESIMKALAFFHSLGPKYEQMAINLLKETKITKGKNTESSAYNIKLSANEFDESFIVHELTHSFIWSEEQAIRPIYVKVSKEEYSPIFSFINKINSYVLQLLFYDFCEFKEGIKRNRLDALYYMMVISGYINNFDALEKEKEAFKLLNCEKSEENVSKILKCFGLNPSTNQYNSQYSFSESMLLSYSHPFGMMVACYIYQEILKEPSNIKMYLGLEKAQGMVGDEESIIRNLEKLRIPCFKNGKISLDEECVFRLSKSLIETFNMCMEKDKKNNISIFNKYPVIDEKYIEEVNEIFNETEQKKI